MPSAWSSSAGGGERVPRGAPSLLIVVLLVAAGAVSAHSAPESGKELEVVVPSGGTSIIAAPHFDSGATLFLTWRVTRGAGEGLHGTLLWSDAVGNESEAFTFSGKEGTKTFKAPAAFKIARVMLGNSWQANITVVLTMTAFPSVWDSPALLFETVVIPGIALLGVVTVATLAYREKRRKKRDEEPPS